MGVMKQFSLFDEETGEVFQSTIQKVGNKLKGGWIVVYKEPIQKLLKEVPNFATLKVYLTVATTQDFETVTMISLSKICEINGMVYQTVWNAIKWLKKHGYLAVGEVNGEAGLVVNPTVSTCGKKNLEKRMEYFTSEVEETNFDDLTFDDENSEVIDKIDDTNDFEFTDYTDDTIDEEITDK